MALAAAAFALLAIHGAFQLSALDAYETALDCVFAAGLTGLLLAWSVGQWGSARAGRVLLRVGVMTAAVVVPLVAAELGTRYIFRDVRTSADGRSYFAHRGGPPTRTNHLGFREREIGPPSPDRYRIVIVGDSLTWGQGIEERDRASNLLQDYLGPNYEVLNFGIPGNNLPEHLQVLEQALRFSPDFVLLQLYINDFETPEMERPNPKPVLPWEWLDRTMLGSSAIYDMVTDFWSQFQERSGMIESYPHYMQRNLEDPASPNSRKAFGMLRQFIERSRAAGAQSGTVLFPNPGLLGKTIRSATCMSGCVQVCADERVTCLDLRGSLSAGFRNPMDMWVSRFDPHPNARTNQRAAREILAAFGGSWHRPS